MEIGSLRKILRQLVVALEELSSLGIGFISYQDNLDFSTAQGRLMFHIIGAMAEFERELIRERVKAGIENARRKGKRLGRKPIPPVDKDKIIALFQKDSSMSVRKIARKVGMSSGFVGRTLKEHRMNKDSVLL
jgi:DNA invertase Pin-like site-specific DNA recombinase